MFMLLLNSIETGFDDVSEDVIEMDDVDIDDEPLLFSFEFKFDVLFKLFLLIGFALGWLLFALKHLNILKQLNKLNKSEHSDENVNVDFLL